MADNEQIMSGRDRIKERYKKTYPDNEYTDDDALFGQINDDFDQYDADLSAYREREKNLVDTFNKNPSSAQFITDVALGKDPWSELIKRIGIDGVKEILENPEKLDQFAKDNQEYVERLAKEKSLKAEWQKNMQETTIPMLNKKKEQYNLTDEQLDEAADWVRDVTNDAVVGLIREETFDMALKALNYDRDLAAANAEGEIRGKNAKAEAMLRKPQRGDGTVALAGANNASSPVRNQNSIFSIADGAR